MKIIKNLLQRIRPPLETVMDSTKAHEVQPPLTGPLDQVVAGSNLLPDHSMMEAYLAFAADCKTNCDDAAGALISMAYKIHLVKPHLDGPLLRKALEPVYFLGIEDPSALPAWTAAYRERVRRYNPGWDDPALAWIDDLALTKPQSLGEAFEHLRKFGRADYSDIAWMTPV